MSDFLSALRNPLIDKLIAIIACAPFLAVLAAQIRSGTLDVPRAVVIAHMLLQVLTMFARRAPERVSPRPVFWLLAFLASYWPFLMNPWVQPGRPLTPGWATDLLSLASLGIVAYARLSLGRNIGFVPAERRLVTRGAYRYVRHPIYSGIFLSYLSFALRAGSPINAAIMASGAALFMIKSVVEERFLAGNPEYRSYLDRVRWRWIPGIA